VLGCLAAAGIAVALISGGGGSSSSSSVSLLTESVQAQPVQAIRRQEILQTKQIAAPGGYSYRLVLATVRAAPGALPATRRPLFLTLHARRGRAPFVLVESRRLPWRWTVGSIVTQFQLDPNPDGSGNVGLSWLVLPRDQNTVTHYFTITPQGININS
jgi:hypothetical protein